MPSRVRAALLAAAMNVGTVAPLDALRFLRVPAIHLVLRREVARWCRARVCRRSRWR